MAETTIQATFSPEDFLKNFPFETIRPKQIEVLKKICDAYNSGIKTVVLEAPTGFGKSPVALAVARTLGSSYICSATKDLQTQYVNDFPFLIAVKGMNNFSCLVKEDFIKNKTYACGKCGLFDSSVGRRVTNTDECNHNTVDYGPCRGSQISYKHDKKTCNFCRDNRANGDGRFHNGCRYRTYQEDYEIQLKNTDNERIEISELRREQYEKWYKVSNNNNDFWMHAKNFADFEEIRNTFVPCPYYDQLNKGIISSHSIFNYANFLTFLRMKNGPLPRRDLLVLDEGHSIENQLLGQIEVSLSKKVLQKYISKDIFENITYGYCDPISEKWLLFLRLINQELENAIPSLGSDETRLDAWDHLLKIKQAIESIEENPTNWIVSNIEKENGKVIKVQFKPLNLSGYCKKLFEKCDRMFIMSATIMDLNSFCRSVGLDLNDVKFIQADSDFPIQNRPIYKMNIAYLNYNTLQQEEVQREISVAVDRIMSNHNAEKGIIHCTSYAQVNFIEKYISTLNKKRLIETDPERLNGRDLAISEHFTSEKPTVLISPSLHTGLDLKDERSRFQIIVKVPYPSRNDRWIEAKREGDEGWYNWQTAIKLVQAYGRSVRSINDWAKTYVLDAAFNMFVNRNTLPTWYTKAIK